MCRSPLLPAWLRAAGLVICMLVLLAAGAAVGLRYGNAQWGSPFYLFQRNVWPATPRRIPSNFSGTWTQWRSLGRKALEAECRNGDTHGKMVFWHLNGPIAEERTYVRGVQHGRTRHWDEHGNVIADGVYVSGKPYEGTFTTPFGQRRPWIRTYVGSEYSCHLFP